MRPGCYCGCGCILRILLFQFLCLSAAASVGFRDQNTTTNTSSNSSSRNYVRSGLGGNLTNSGNFSKEARQASQQQQQSQQQNFFKLHILHVNDHHSHLDEDTFHIPQSQLPQVSNAARIVSYGGFPRIIRMVQEANYENLLKLHAGDALVGTAFFDIFGYKPDVEMMHQVCFDAVGLGNHEFDYGDQLLADYISDLTMQSCTRLLCANLAPASNSPLKPLQDAGYIAPYTIKQFPNGQKVGIIGVNVRGHTMSTSHPSPGTVLLDERQAVQAQIYALQAKGVDKIVLVSHVGIGLDERWWEDMVGIDVIVGGHSHTLLGMDTAALEWEPEGPYPIVEKDKAGRMMCLVHAWKFGHVLGLLEVVFDSYGNVVSCAGVPMIPYETNPDANSNEASIVVNYLNSLGPSFVQTRELESARAALDVYQKSMGNAGRSGNTNGIVMRSEATQGSCNVMDILYMIKTADFIIQNYGGCGTVIKTDAQLYANDFRIFSLTGTEIQHVLEGMLIDARKDQSAFPMVSGLRFALNASQPIGQQVSCLQINSRMQEGTWNDIDPNGIYAVAVNATQKSSRSMEGYSDFTDQSTKKKKSPVVVISAAAATDDDGQQAVVESKTMNDPNDDATTLPDANYTTNTTEEYAQNVTVTVTPRPTTGEVPEGATAFPTMSPSGTVGSSSLFTSTSSSATSSAPRPTTGEVPEGATAFPTMSPSGTVGSLSLFTSMSSSATSSAMRRFRIPLVFATILTGIHH